MGSTEFSKQLSALTGSKKTVGPPPSLRVGAAVEVRNNGNWHPAKIVSVQAAVPAVNVPQSFTVQYPDGTEEPGLKEPQIRLVKGKGESTGGVLFLDEAYDLDPSANSEGRAILADIMAVAEDYRDTVTIILAGYQDDIERKLFSFNIGLASRFDWVQFEDFNEAELHQIWVDMCAKGKVGVCVHAYVRVN